MNITFICSSLEVGRNGVGDYTRRLGMALQRRGITVHALALHDRYATVASPEAGEVQETGEGSLRVWRLPVTKPWKERMATLQHTINRLHPDWLSLQFVPYGYHRRGWCFGLGRHLRCVAPRVRRHIFFHELTTGIAVGDSVKNCCDGIAQRFAIRRLLGLWPPHALHTHLPLYQAQLLRWGSGADLLPLFGNIPIVGSGPVCLEVDSWIARRAADPYEVVLGGFFGNFYASVAKSGLFAGLQRMAVERKATVVLFLAGRQAGGAMDRWQEMANSNFDRLRWVCVGELDPATVSRYLQALDFGVSATPWQLVGKSGSVAAMLDHGLPVLVPRNDFASKLPIPPYAKPHGLLIDLMKNHSWPEGHWLKLKRPPHDSAPDIAAQFVKDLEGHVSSLSPDRLHAE